jgi:hypothetical protein
LKSREEAADEENLIEVPIEYKAEFERDIALSKMFEELGWGLAPVEDVGYVS